MDKKYIRGNNDKLTRFRVSKHERTYINSSLRKRLLKLCIKEAFQFYRSFFDMIPKPVKLDELVIEYEKEYAHAKSINLLKSGGAREKDHLNLWCLGRVLTPELYIESGVSSGSSLHAFLKSPKLSRLIAIDPDLTKLKITTGDMPNLTLIDEQDFGQCEIHEVPDNTLIYFDDHINSALRIIQSYEKGIKYLLFDDSNGLEGICQRFYPSIPSVPMVLNWESFKVNDELRWTRATYPKSKFKLANKINQLMGRQKPTWKQLQFKFDEEMLAQCQQAKTYIKKHTKIPDLGEYLPQDFPEKGVDNSKYLLELSVK